MVSTVLVVMWSSPWFDFKKQFTPYEYVSTDEGIHYTPDVSLNLTWWLSDHALYEWEGYGRYSPCRKYRMHQGKTVGENRWNHQDHDTGSLHLA